MTFKGCTKIIALALVSLLLFGCAAPTPEADLAAAVAVLDVISVLPNLTAQDRTWIAAAATGLNCASGVLVKGEPVAQESIDIAACFVSLPVVPASDQVYISAGIAAVEVFIALFEPQPTPAAISANDKVRKMSVLDRSKYLESFGINAKVLAIHAKVEKH